MGKHALRVLLVDDEESVREPLATQLRLHYKYDVDVAANGEDALSLLEAENGNYQVALVDQVLDDGLRGIDLLKQIKSKHPDIQIIIFTGWGMEDGLEALHQGAYRYFAKPFNLEELAMTIRFAAEEKMAAISKKVGGSSRKSQYVFVLMPFANRYKIFYEDVIKRRVEAMGLMCKRADDFFLSSVIMEDILNLIKKAKFILSDFSGKNPNVFFETGIAQSLHKTTIFLSQDLQDVPPMLRNIRCHLYKDSLDGAKEFPAILKKIIGEIQSKGYPSLFKKRKIRKKSNLCLALMAKNKNGERTYNQLILEVAQQLGLDCTRAGETFDPKSVLDQIWTRINEAAIVVADLTGRDSDVFYQAGLAFGLGKTVVFISQFEKDIPFDLKRGSSLIYSLDSYASGKNAKKKLYQIMNELMQ
jgi:DNA-binding response OmpR family regulator